ncbi:LysR family transcriptional regulator [Acidovorax delafieldii 2AN]|uniref:LysR family transcriptional regulator n=2 Tax=Acidovorax delafieldii TaxID=47920 RepID=C5TBN6_ACIDE|nr:LysR family transcriptional regulator [Acidovorax delafieldii 2AN]
MSAQRFDLGLGEQTATPPGTQAEVLLTLDEVAVLPSGHTLAKRPVLGLGDFAGLPFVSLSVDDPYRRQIDALFAQAGVQRALRVETHSAAAVCAMVQQGLGVAVVNPLTALAAVQGSGGALVLRRLAFSVPFSVSMVRPLFRATLPEVVPMLHALRLEAQALGEKFREMASAA